MSLIPAIAVINGSGKPRLMLIQSSLFYSSTGVLTFDSLGVTEAEGATTNITSSAISNPGRILTASPHGRSIGDWVRIAGHSGSTPSINSKYQILNVSDSTHFDIDVNITVGGTGGTVQLTPAYASRGIAVNRRISIPPLSAGRTIYGKVISVDDVNNKILVDAWVGGTPTNTIFNIDGWISDLPRCYDETETFAPDVLVHDLYRSRKGTKSYGWLYTAVLDYAAYISGDTMLLMRQHLNMKGTDSLILIPRVDQPSFNYRVYFSTPISMSIYGKALGHKKPIFGFAGKDPVASFPIIDGYGTDFADGFGTHL